MSEQAKLLEPDDLLTMPDGDRYELIDGHLVERNMGAESDRIALRLGGLVDQYCLDKSCGLAFGSQTGYRCFPNNPKQIRKPDVSFVAAGRLPGDKSPKGDISIAPDFVVEVVSPNDTYEEIQIRVEDYKSAKVKLIWVICPPTKSVLIRRLDGTCAELSESGTLSGEDVIPGFACPVAKLFV